MEVIKTVFFLLIGFVLLIKAADIFVDAVSSIASHFKMSKMMIALTIAAFGTCAPELAISFNSIASNQGDIALANVIGSNVINILLVIGLAACFATIKVKNSTIKKELPILIGVTSVFTFSMAIHLLINKSSLILTRLEGILFILLFLFFIFYIISVVKSKKGTFEVNKPKYKIGWSIILTIVCCVVIIAASELVVNNAKALATMANVSTKIITMTIVVIGTSLPELTMTIVAAKKNEFDIALGNIIGTNIFNIGIVLGLPLATIGGFTSTSFNLIDILAIQIAAVLFYFFSKNDKTLSRKEGIIMLIIFLLYYVYIFIQ